MFSSVKLTFATVVALAVGLMGGCATLKDSLDVVRPSAEVTSVQVAGLTADGVDLVVNLAIHNPNRFALDAVGVDMELKVEDTSLVSLNQADRGLSLPANGSASAGLPVSLRFADVYNTFTSLQGKDTFDYSIDAGFLLNLPVIGNVRIPAEFSDSLPIPKMPQITFRSATLTDISWQGASMALVVDVLNPNSFGIDLNSLNYQVVSGGKSLAAGKVSAATLADGEQQQLTIPLSLGFAELGSSLIRLLQGSQPVDIGLTGNLDFTPELSIWKPAPVTFDVHRSLSK